MPLYLRRSQVCLNHWPSLKGHNLAHSSKLLWITYMRKTKRDLIEEVMEENATKMSLSRACLRIVWLILP